MQTTSRWCALKQPKPTNESVISRWYNTRRPRQRHKLKHKHSHGWKRRQRQRSSKRDDHPFRHRLLRSTLLHLLESFSRRLRGHGQYNPLSRCLCQTLTIPLSSQASTTAGAAHPPRKRHSPQLTTMIGAHLSSRLLKSQLTDVRLKWWLPVSTARLRCPPVRRQARLLAVREQQVRRLPALQQPVIKPPVLAHRARR